MSSNYTFCGYDMMDPNSKAGQAGEGINLNSVTVQYNLQNTQYQTKLSPSYPQSYPQWICRRKIDLKNKSKCFILT